MSTATAPRPTTTRPTGRPAPTTTTPTPSRPDGDLTTTEGWDCSDAALGLMVRRVAQGMGLWVLAFAALAGVAGALAPQLAGLDLAATATFVLMSGGFGLIPGVVVGIGRAEAELGHH